MKILSIGNDESVCVPDSAAHLRQAAYARALGRLTIITPARHAPESFGKLVIHPVRNRFLIPFAVAKIIRADKPDVVTVQDPFEFGLLAYIGMIGSGVPLHVQVHTDFLSPEFLRYSILNKIRTSIASLVLRRAAAIRTVSERIRRSIQAQYRLRVPISVLPIFVDIARFGASKHRSHPRFKRALLFVGRLEREKRADVAIETLARVRALGIDAGLTIVGEGTQREKLLAYARERDVLERVIFTGTTSDPLSHYVESDLQLVPSAYEGYGLVIIEALAAGIPVLATDVGIAREAGAIIAPHDVEGFTKVACDLFSRPELPEGRLVAYPYHSEEEYVMAWAKDVSSARK